MLVHNVAVFEIEIEIEIEMNYPAAIYGVSVDSRAVKSFLFDKAEPISYTPWRT